MSPPTEKDIFEFGEKIGRLEETNKHLVKEVQELKVAQKQTNKALGEWIVDQNGRIDSLYKDVMRASLRVAALAAGTLFGLIKFGVWLWEHFKG